MKLRNYLTYQGTCEEAIELYKRALKLEPLQIMRFSDMPTSPDFQIPEEFQNKIAQATMSFGDDFIRMSDCGPGQPLNDQESERLSIVVEASVEEIQHAFAVLAEEGRVGMALEHTFYSPCAGVVFDKFGVMWNLAAQ